VFLAMTVFIMHYKPREMVLKVPKNFRVYGVFILHEFLSLRLCHFNKIFLNKIRMLVWGTGTTIKYVGYVPERTQKCA